MLFLVLYVLYFSCIVYFYFLWAALGMVFLAMERQGKTQMN